MVFFVCCILERGGSISFLEEGGGDAGRGELLEEGSNLCEEQWLWIIYTKRLEHSLKQDCIPPPKTLTLLQMAYFEVARRGGGLGLALFNSNLGNPKYIQNKKNIIYYKIFIEIFLLWKVWIFSEATIRILLKTLWSTFFWNSVCLYREKAKFAYTIAWQKIDCTETTWPNIF